MTAISPDVVAFSRSGNPAPGEFGDAVVICRIGEVPSLDNLLGG